MYQGMIMTEIEKVYNFLSYLKYDEKLYIYEQKSTLPNLIKKLDNLKSILSKYNMNKLLLTFIILEGFRLVIEDSKKNIMIDFLETLTKRDVFIPETFKDFALVHQTHNKSDLNKTDSSIFYKRDIFLDFKEENLKIIFANKTSSKNLKHSKILFIVENYKIFELKNPLPYFNSFDLGIDISEYKNIDFMYGAGNKINTPKLGFKFFSTYEDILYFGDYDDEGYKIYKKLSSNNDNIRFILPNHNIIKDIQKLMDKEDIQYYRSNCNIKNYFIKNTELLKLINLSQNKVYEMQQEVFILS